MKVIFSLLLTLFAGCVNTEAIEYLQVDDAKGKKVFNAATEFCGGLGNLTQSCDAWQGANLQIEISKQKMRIAGNEGGTLILIMHSKDICGVGEYCVTLENNISYEVVKEKLVKNGLSIKKINTVAVSHHISGYLASVNGDAYSLLKSYAEED